MRMAYVMATKICKYAKKRKKKKEEKRRLGIVLIYILTDVLKFTKLLVCVCKPKLPLSKHKCRIGTTQ